MTKKMSRRLFTAGGAIAAALFGTAKLALPKAEAATPVTTTSFLRPEEMTDDLLAVHTAQEILRWAVGVKTPATFAPSDSPRTHRIEVTGDNRARLSGVSFDLGRQPLKIDEFLSRVRGTPILIHSVLEQMLKVLGVCSVATIDEYRAIVNSDSPKQRLERLVTPRTTLDIDDFMKPAVAAYTLVMHARGLQDAQYYAHQAHGRLFEPSVYVKREAFMLELTAYVSVVYPAAVFMQEFRAYETGGFVPVR